MTIIDQLAQFDLRRGKEPINPTVIQGSEGLPPVDMAGIPGGQELRPASESYGTPADFDDPPPATPQSPLVGLGLGHGPQAVPGPAASQDGFRAGVDAILEKLGPKGVDLWVRDGEASFRGRMVDLAEEDKKAIAKVLLKALKRSLDLQYQEVAGVSPRMRAPKKVRKSRSGPATGS